MWLWFLKLHFTFSSCTFKWGSWHKHTVSTRMCKFALAHSCSCDTEMCKCTCVLGFRSKLTFLQIWLIHVQKDCQHMDVKHYAETTIMNICNCWTALSFHKCCQKRAVCVIWLSKINQIWCLLSSHGCKVLIEFAGDDSRCISRAILNDSVGE